MCLSFLTVKQGGPESGVGQGVSWEVWYLALMKGPTGEPSTVTSESALSQAPPLSAP